MSETGPQDVALQDRKPQKRAEPISRRTRLMAVLRTPEGRRQALLLVDVLAPPVAVRRRRAIGPLRAGR